MIEIKTNGITILAVPVPEDCEIKLAGRRLMIHLKMQGAYWKNCYELARSIYIPNPFYEPLGLLSEITEEVAAGIVERHRHLSIKPWYDYEYTDSRMYTALESLQSLIKSNGMNENVYLLKKIE